MRRGSRYEACSAVVGEALGPDVMKSVKRLLPDLLEAYPLLLYQGGPYSCVCGAACDLWWRKQSLLQQQGSSFTTAGQGWEERPPPSCCCTRAQPPAAVLDEHLLGRLVAAARWLSHSRDAFCALALRR